MVVARTVFPLLVWFLSCCWGCQQAEQQDLQFVEELSVESGDGSEQGGLGGFRYTSLEGGFEVLWPSGCDKIKVHARDDPESDDPLMFSMVYVFCDRENRPQEGCLVQVYFKLRDEFGGPPTPAVVIEQVKQVMTSYQVEIQTQTPIRRGPLEGLQVHCKEPEGKGEVWVEGLMLAERVFILAAWKSSGGLFDSQEIKDFFESFSLTPVDDSG